MMTQLQNLPLGWDLNSRNNIMECFEMAVWFMFRYKIYIYVSIYAKVITHLPTSTTSLGRCSDVPTMDMV